MTMTEKRRWVAAIEACWWNNRNDEFDEFLWLWLRSPGFKAVHEQGYRLYMAATEV